ncbi:MAG: hypothetical protein HPY57_14935 [Ignavibacteria bacterium]|nr:hypothetical protein [Ignavibacteria bacterium]
MGLYYNGEEYIIFSPLDFDTAYKYGDHSWCINREPQYFYGDEYKASYGGVIQCINKINSYKNLAIQIDNINSIYSYDYEETPLEITIWDANNDHIYNGTYDDFKHELSKWCEKYNITSIREILDVLDKIEKNGIDPDTYIGDSLDNMWDNFNPNFDETLEWAIKNKKVNDLLCYIINEGDSDIYNAVSDMFLENENSINKQIVVDILSINLDANFYIKKYNLNIDTNKKSPREIWQQIYDMIGVEEVIKLLNKTDIVHLLDEETSKIYLEYLSELVDLDKIDYKDFIDLDINKNFEDWKTFQKMLKY